MFLCTKLRSVSNQKQVLGRTEPRPEPPARTRPPTLARPPPSEPDLTLDCTKEYLEPPLHVAHASSNNNRQSLFLNCLGARLAFTSKPSGPPKSANFSFLAKRYPDLDRIGAGCERYFSDDPVVTLILLRQFGEVLAQMLAARSGLLTDARELQADLLRRLRVEGNYPSSVVDLFHQLRKLGNAATHDRDGDHATALSCLKMARQLAIWFYRTFDDQNLKPGPFQPPQAPADASAELKSELERLRAEKDAALTEAQRAMECGFRFISAGYSDLKPAIVPI
ncbi:hypothetical protein ACVWZV_009237 [Bradyrhizobium sp. GM5.1]